MRLDARPQYKKFSQTVQPHARTFYLEEIMPIEDSDPRVRAKEKRRENKAKQKENQNVGFKGFINATPSQDDKTNFAGWLGEPDVFSDALDDATTRGYKIAVTYEPNGDYYRATAVTWNGDDPNAGVILSCRAGDALRALARCVWWLSWKCAYKIGAPEQARYDQDQW